MSRVKCQSILEYGVFIAIIMTALLVMQIYIKRGFQGRLKQDIDSISSQHYDSTYTTSLITTSSSTEMESYTGGSTYAGGLAGASSIEVPEGLTVTYSNNTASFGRLERTR